MYFSSTTLVTLSLLSLLSLFSSQVQADGHQSKSPSHHQLRLRQYADHPDWTYLNAMPWFKLDATQQDHARLHSYLSMAAYGNYEVTCPQTFLRGFTVLQKFKNGFVAQVPEMNKVVIVFRGSGDYRSIDWTPTTVEDIVANCSGCQVARGIKSLYLEIKAATSDFTLFKQAIARTKLLSSVTGHGVGGSLAALAALDLGARGYMHYSHNQGMPRTFNYASVVRYDNLFQVLAGQSLVARNDFSVAVVPLGPLVHVGSKMHITGNQTQWLTNCFGNNENSTCLGTGTSMADHEYYFTPLGQCGASDKGY